MAATTQNTRDKPRSKGRLIFYSYSDVRAPCAGSYICDPPRDFRDKGERTGTRAMTRHAKRVIMTRICAYLIIKTKSVTVGFVCSDGVSNVTLTVQFGTRAIGHACQIARVRKDT